MTRLVRWTVLAVLVVHRLIHLLGVAEGFGWADVAALTQPVSARAGLLWLVAGALVLGSAVLVSRRAPSWWWVIAAAGAVVSPVAIATSWDDDDARAGTVANVLLALLAAYGFVSEGTNQHPRLLAGTGRDRHDAGQGPLRGHRRRRSRSGDGSRGERHDLQHPVVLAPGAIVDASVRWVAVDDQHVRGVFANGDQAVTTAAGFPHAGHLHRC